MWDTDKIEQVYRAALRQAGVVVPITRQASALTVEVDGYAVEIGLEPAEWLRVAVRLFAVNSATLSNNHFLMPPGGAGVLLEAVSKINQTSFIGRLSVQDHGHAVVGDVTLYLFGGGDPAFAQNGVTIFNVDCAREALCLQLNILSELIGALFKELHVQRPAPRFHPSGWTPRFWAVDALPFVKRWLDQAGIPAHEGRGKAAGTITFAWGEPPAAVFLGTHTGRLGIIRPMISMFEHATCPAPIAINALYGPVNWTAELICNDLNATHFGPRYEASVQRGVLSVSLAALALRPSDLARPVMWNIADFLDLLRGETANLLSALRIPAFLGSSESARRKRVSEGGNLGQRERKISHRWQRAAARELIENVTGQRGWILSGYKIATASRPVEIDNILVCESGLFVLDCWSCSGTITGSLNGEWLESHQPLARHIGSKGLRPVDRVLQHAFALKNAIERSAPQSKPFVRGIALFPDNADLRLENIAVDTFAGNVPSAYRLGAFVRALNDPASSRSLSPGQVDQIAGVIEQLQ